MTWDQAEALVARGVATLLELTRETIRIATQQEPPEPKPGVVPPTPEQLRVIITVHRKPGPGMPGHSDA